MKRGAHVIADVSFSNWTVTCSCGEVIEGDPPVVFAEHRRVVGSTDRRQTRFARATPFGQGLGQFPGRIRE